MLAGFFNTAAPWSNTLNQWLQWQSKQKWWKEVFFSTILHPRLHVLLHHAQFHDKSCTRVTLLQPKAQLCVANHTSSIHDMVPCWDPRNFLPQEVFGPNSLKIYQFLPNFSIFSDCQRFGQNLNFGEWFARIWKIALFFKFWRMICQGLKNSAIF